MWGESRFLENHSPLGNVLPPQSGPLGDLVLLLKWSFGDMVILVIVQAALPLQSTLNVTLDSMAITITLKGGKFKRNIGLKLYFISSRNVCNPGYVDVPCVHKCAHFTCELEASSSRSKKFDLECSTPPWANATTKLICLWGLALTPKPTIIKNTCF